MSLNSLNITNSLFCFSQLTNALFFLTLVLSISGYWIPTFVPRLRRSAQSSSLSYLQSSLLLSFLISRFKTNYYHCYLYREKSRFSLCRFNNNVILKVIQSVSEVRVIIVTENYLCYKEPKSPYNARHAGSDGSMSASGSAGPGFDLRRGSKFSFENFQPPG